MLRAIPTRSLSQSAKRISRSVQCASAIDDASTSHRPWHLMGRVIRAPDDVSDMAVGFARKMLRDAGWTDEDITAGMDTLQALLPDVATNLRMVRSDIIVALLEEQELVLPRIIRLREALPYANVSKIVAAFPSVVLDDFEKAMHELEKLAVAYEPREFCHIVDTAPIILLEDLDVIIPDMQRLLGLEDRETAYKKLLTTPNLVLNLASNRNLSIW